MKKSGIKKTQAKKSGAKKSTAKKAGTIWSSGGTAHAGSKCILVTGAAGYIGSLFVQRMLERPGDFRIIGIDVKLPRYIPEGLEFFLCDISSPKFNEVFDRVRPDVVVHLASIVSPPKNSDPDFEYRVDVLGTENVLKACVKSGVKKIVLTSSGAAYGYHADNPEWLKENDALRGNDSFSYSKHKRLVEEMLAVYRKQHPKLAQLIFRPGTVLGAGTHNQITNLFEKRFVPGIAGSLSPFVFIWDEDVVECLAIGASSNKSGIYNLAGDGKLTLPEIARILGKPFLPIPPKLLMTAFGLLKPVGLSRYGPEQVDFLRYRPVMTNEALKKVFGFIPRKTTREVFQFYVENSPYIRGRR